MDAKNKNFIFYFFVALIIAAGVAIRVLFYSYARPFWNDESALALNIVGKRYIELFGVMDYYQFAPPLFCVVCKFFLIFIKKAEYALRLLPLIFSCLSLPVFFILSRKILRSRIAVIFSLILFSFNYQLVYFAQELKPYSAEVFFFLSILIFAFSIDYSKWSRTKFILSSIFLAVSVWFSYTAVFALFVLFFVLFLFKDKRQTAFLSILPLVSCLILFVHVFSFSKDNFLHNFWASGFINKDFSNLGTIITGNGFFYFPDFSSKIFIVMLFLMGIWLFVRDVKNIRSQVVILAFSFSVILAYLNIYPIYLRTCLYLFPIFILIISKPFDCIGSKYTALNCLIVGFLFAHFFINTLKTDYSLIVNKNYYVETTQQLLEKFIEISKSDEILVVPMSSKINYEFYKNTVDIEKRNIIVMKKFLYESSEIESAYSKLPKGHTYYIILSHSSDKPMEYKNLCTFAKGMKNTEVLKDRYYNALIKFSN